MVRFDFTVYILYAYLWVKISLCQGHFYHTAVRALPFPAYAARLIVAYQPFLSQPLEKPRFRPFAEILTDAAGRPAPYFPGQRFPPDAGPQHIKDGFLPPPGFRRQVFPSSRFR
jgi:hypothetical protein